MTLSQGDPLQSWLTSLGLSKRDANLVCKDINTWLSNSGMEWTIQRLKTLRSAYIQFLGGNPYELPWLSNRKHGGILTPKGVWGKLWTRDEKRVPVSLKVFHLYSRFILTQVSDSQKKKFLDSVWAMPMLRIDKVLQENVATYASTYSFRSKPYRRSLIASVNALPPVHRKKFPRDFRRGIDYLRVYNRWFPDITSQWGGFDRWFSRRYDIDISAERQTARVGNLGISQERGGKLRVYAFPNLLFQVMMNPLKASLFRILKRIPEDCTYDQKRGVTWVQEKLQAGHCAWSVDLSDATNHFSFELQKLVLLNIFLNPEWENHLELFEMVSKGQYGAKALGHNFVRWTKGQPLGVGPSFPLFAITHHAVLYHCKVVAGEVDTDCYRILGDDIVITSPKVATEYLRVLQQLSVPVSPAKTVTSKEVAEFAGSVIYRGLEVPSTKWKKQITLGNITHEAGMFGVRAAKLIPESWRADYLEWYSVYHHNATGMTSEERLNRKVAVITYQQEQMEKKTLVKERKTFRALYWSILADDPNESLSTPSPDQGDVRATWESFGISPVAVDAKTPSTTYGPNKYAFIHREVNWKPIGGELRSYRRAVQASNQGRQLA